MVVSVCAVRIIAATSMYLTLPALFACAWAPATFAGPTLHANSFDLNTRQTKGCDQLAAKFPSLVSYPNSTIYDTENQGKSPRPHVVCYLDIKGQETYS